MSIIEEIKKRAKINKKRIVLPEASDERIVDAAVKSSREEIADIVLIGEPCKKVEDDNIEIIIPSDDPRIEEFANKLYELRKDKGMTLDKAKDLLLNDYMYFACMLVKLGYADGIVSGASHSTASTLRPALQIIKTKPGVELASSFFLMVVPNCKYGCRGTFVFADAGLTQNPSAEDLATIAGMSAKSFQLLVNEEPIVAMLSYSTKGSAVNEDLKKVIEATKLAKKKYSGFQIDGELQLDAAIDPVVAKIKAPNSTVAGHANVLIFPNLDAGNIGYKLVQRLAKANAYGPITQGMNMPVNDLSRGCSVDDIIGVIAITAIQV